MRVPRPSGLRTLAARVLDRLAPGPVRARVEPFGGIVALERPPMLAFVDRPMMEELGYRDEALWGSGRRMLTAPTEVHLTVTNACPAGCRGCYVDARDRRPDELGTDELKRVLDDLAAAGLFHVAIGGGEPLVRPDLIELAEHARSVGLVPNMTTSGIGLTPELARRCRVFGQVNVSWDGVGEAERAAGRSRGSAELAERALETLRRAGVRTGVNCVVTRFNLDHLEELARRARRLGVREIEFLRFKPSGRGKDEYLERRLTPEQAERVYPLILSLATGARIRPRIDCSFLPFACHHGVDRDKMYALGMLGCEAGHHLLSIDERGVASPCSFVEEGERLEGPLGPALDASEMIGRYRSFRETAPEPCASCDYLEVCGGGCRAVSHHLTGDPFAPDPECPRVRAHAINRTGGSERRP